MNKKLKFGLATLASVVIMSGCSVQHENEKITKETMKKTQDIYAQGQLKTPDSLVSQSDQVYLANNAFKIVKHQVLPSIFYKKIVYTTQASESLLVTLQNIAKLTKMQIRFAQDARDLVASITSKQTGIASVNDTFKNVLDQLTNKNGLFWSFDGKSVQIFAMETKVYALDAPLGDFKISSDMSSSSDTSSGSDSSATSGTTQMGVNYSVNASSPWEAAVKTIKNMMSPNGKMDTDPVEGYVTITDNPINQKKIAEYISKINDRSNKKIAVRVDVYNLATTSGSNYGFNVDAILKAMGTSVEWKNDSSSILDSSTGAMNTFTFTGQGDKRTTVLSALNSLGKATEVTGSTIYTISGQPAPIQNAVQTSYLKSISTTSTTDAGTTTSYEPGTISTGYSMTVTPRMQSNNQILVSLNLSIATLANIKTIGGTEATGDSTAEQIQLPEVHTKNFLENMILRSGQSLMIAGFQDDQASTDTASPTSPAAWFVGGAKATSHTKNITVVVVTPYIIGG